MKKILLLALILIASTVFAQDEADPLHKLLTRESIFKCSDYAYNASMLIPQYYENGDLDSIMIVLKYWEDKCGQTDRILRAKILMTIRNNEFSEDIYDDDVIYFAIRGRRIMERRMEYGYNAWSDPEHVDDNFDKFIKKLAQEVCALNHEGTIEYLWGQYFSNEFNYFFNELKKTQYNGTKLRRIYLETIDTYKYNRGGQSHYAVPFGMWHPIGNLSLVGDHPDLGLEYGKRNGKNQLDMSIYVRFLDADQIYYVSREDGVVDSTDDFVDFYIGFDYSRFLSRLGPIELWAVAGLAYEGMTTVDDLPKDGQDRKVIIGTLNGNVGLATKIYLNKYQTWYLGFYGRFNAVNFNTRAGTDLSGNVITYGIKIGYYTMGSGNEILKALNFFD